MKVELGKHEIQILLLALIAWDDSDYSTECAVRESLKSRLKAITKVKGLLEQIDGVNSQINAALKLPTTPWPHSHKVIGLIGKKVYLLDGIVRLICERENEK